MQSCGYQTFVMSQKKQIPLQHLWHERKLHNWPGIFVGLQLSHVVFWTRLGSDGNCARLSKTRKDTNVRAEGACGSHTFTLHGPLCAMKLLIRPIMYTFCLLYLSCVYFLQTNASCNKIDSIQIQGWGQGYSLDTQCHHAFTWERKCYPGKKACNCPCIFFFQRHLFTYMTILTWGRKYFVIHLLVAKWKMPPPHLPAAPFWKMDDSLELTWHFFCPHKFGHGRTIGTICQLARSRQSVSQSCLPPKKKTKHLEAWGSECKCEYIHPHAALLNLWA